MGHKNTALVAGAVGRLGEAILNAVIARGGYRQVLALAQASRDGELPSMSFGMDRLSLATTVSLPAIDDVFILVGDPADAHSRSFHGRDMPFLQVHRANLAAVSQAAAAAGARRVVLVSPLPAWQQVGRFHRALGDETELAISQMSFERLLILRPTRQGGPQAAGWLQRVVSVYMSIQLLMLPRSIPQLTSEQVARAMLRALEAGGDAVSVLDAEGLAAFA